MSGELIDARDRFKRPEPVSPPAHEPPYIMAGGRGRRAAVWLWFYSESGCKTGENLSFKAGVSFVGIDEAREWARSEAAKRGVAYKESGK